ncbi:flagellar hook-length control protein FliK [Bradyrhizobium archetypum]|uniref:Flagellar hook-length control protein FliK n=1 Tax=Bradyrhizobium archetypum TaxID=2721160 RepID=A0A7Y4H473_9BRAD|nr:flagellar hook-length control protein FliK [Bradyrhizobium archetypum]NOJ47320.1 flagellar hook-length control protein FliK [Bradyrhizobium archetypum]
MVSVTSEVSANASFQSAAARSARPDPERPVGNDSFAALVDSNAASSRNDDRMQDTASAPRRSDDAQAVSDSRARDNTAASDKADKAARDDSNNRDAAQARNDTVRNEKARKDKARDDGKVDARTDSDGKGDIDVKAATTGRTKSKSDAAKSDKAQSDDTTQASSGDASAVADQTETTPDGAAIVTADAVAMAIPAAAAPAPASAAQAADKATAPLAIAAAAIAASASLAAETAPAAAAADAADTATSPAQANARPSAQDGVGQAVSAQATSADPSITTGIAQAAAIVAATPAAGKSALQLKSPDLARKSATTAVERAGTTDTGDIAAPAAPAADSIVPAVAPTTDAAGKPKSEIGIADAAKVDASGNAIAPSATPANTNAHFAAPDVVGQTPLNSSGNGLQAPGAIQTQQPAAPITTSSASTHLTATAATSAAVPVSGLAMEIAASAKSGKTRFEIRLDPAELGRIDVRVDVDRHGQVTSHLTVERPETLSMLRQDANQLQRALDNAGLSTGNGGLQFSLRDQSSQGQNDGNQSNPNAHRLVVSEEDSVPAVVAGRSYGRMLGASGGVDIRV